VFGETNKFKSKRLRGLITFKGTKTKKKKYKSANPFLEDSDEDEINGDARISDLDKNTGNLLPDIREQLEQFNKLIKWTSIGRSKRIPEPVPGLSKEYDEANEKVNRIKNKLNDLLEKTKRLLD